MTEGLSHLHTFCNKLHPLPEASWLAFAEIWQPLKLPRKAMMTQAGEVERHLYFVLEGTQRAYYVTEAGKEQTVVFTYPFSFSGVADAFLLQAPALYFLETLTASVFLRCRHDRLVEVMERHREVERMVARATALALNGALERQIELSSYTSEEKFRTLLKRSPHLLQHIPHKYLANYLGMDPTNFSKLLASVRIS
ncbi:MAG: Crp/Fnr family transcriptional regulator [Saprospiraceae bacterium]|nr:Crp/Fnr family transcriptional regulator [Saprospiraceae bacterium]